MTLTESRTAAPENILTARDIVKRYGRVTALAGADLDLRRGEILGVIGDNGAGKSSLIKAITGALIPDSGEIYVDGERVHFTSPMHARQHGIETVYQTLALAPVLSIAENLFLGRERRRPNPLGRVLRTLDRRSMEAFAREQMDTLGIQTLQDIRQPVESLSGGQRQAVAVARAMAFGSRIVILDEPTAALGVKESRQVLDLIKTIRDRGVSVVLISHDMPHVFEVADRVHIHRLGRRVALVDTQTVSMSEAVSVMTGALPAVGPIL